MQNLTWQGEIKPSRIFAFLLIVLHLGSAMVVYLTNIADEVKWILFVMIVLSLFFYWSRDVRLVWKNSWININLHQNRTSIGTRGNEMMRGHLAGASIVLGCCVIFAAKIEDRQLCNFRVLFWDAMDPEGFRALKVILKLSR